MLSAASPLTLRSAAVSRHGVAALLRPFSGTHEDRVERAFGGGGGDTEERLDRKVEPEEQGSSRSCWARTSLRHIQLATGCDPLSASYILFCHRVISLSYWRSLSSANLLWFPPLFVAASCG